MYNLFLFLYVQWYGKQETDLIFINEFKRKKCILKKYFNCLTFYSPVLKYPEFDTSKSVKH